MTYHPALAAALALMLLLAACDAPETGAIRTPASDGPAPVIRPLDEVLAQTDVPGLEPTDTEALQARAAGLQGRAGALSAAEADAETRARLDAALAGDGG
jgi:hypothetical protein